MIFILATLLVFSWVGRVVGYERSEGHTAKPRAGAVWEGWPLNG